MAKRHPFKETKPVEHCRELVDAADEITRRLYNAIDWMFEYPDYNPTTKAMPTRYGYRRSEITNRRVQISCC